MEAGVDKNHLSGDTAGQKILAFLFDFATARAIRRSLKLPAQEPEPLAHSLPETLELIRAGRPSPLMEWTSRSYPPTL